MTCIDMVNGKCKNEDLIKLPEEIMLEQRPE